MHGYDIVLISIDPGKTAMGWARFNGEGRMVVCGLIRGNSPHGMLCAIRDIFRNVCFHTAVLEIPQVYRQRLTNPNDLIPVAISGGMILGVLDLDHIEFVKPSKWKGQRPKKVCNALTLKTLTEAELAALDDIDCIPSLRHNVVDAIGIGLWKLGRR